MNKVWQIISIILLLLVFLSCNQKKGEKKILLSGKYATCVAGIVERKMLEFKHMKDFKSMAVVLLYLRGDGSFVFGNCNNQILLAGRYSFERDSLSLYNIFNFLKQEWQPDLRLYIDEDVETIHYVLSNDSIPPRFVKKYRFKERVSTLQRNKFKHHSGYLRNENWPLDSLYNYNTYWEHEKQMRYVDSIGLSRYK